MKGEDTGGVLSLGGDSCRIQTCNLLIRSQMLYSVELRSLGFAAGCSPVESECKGTHFLPTGQIFFCFFCNLFFMLLVCSALIDGYCGVLAGATW